MDYSQIPLVNLMKLKLNYHSQRQGVLAENVANADTPNYLAKDVTVPDFGKLLKEETSQSKMAGGMKGLSRTHSGHMNGVGGGNGIETIKRKLTDELNPNGNNVSIEEEMAKVSSNQGEYLKMLNLYAKTISLFKTAIGGGGGNG